LKHSVIEAWNTFQLSAALDNSCRVRAQDATIAQRIMNGHDDWESLSDLE